MKALRIVFTLFTLAAFSCQSQDKSENQLTAEKFQTELANTPDAQLVDVRTPDEFKDGHLKQAMNIDFKSDDFEEHIKALDKDKPVFVYCLAGSRSAGAAKVLAENGFKNVYDMDGGYLKWTAANYPVDEPANAGERKGMSTEDFQKMVASEPVVMIDFNAPWCAPCVKMLPIIHQLEKEYAGKAKVVAINYDENKALAKELGIDEIPAFLMYKKGKLVERKNGLIEEKEFRTWLDAQL
ncbi:rhodanese-like domain-containing protein [Dyadobacter tibetensis]|uniref:rhodanese-like domain-containing protein n=1 Tax=Dyadobacter tibetensis TaxID=1211851 RepID=UPI00046F01D9|nr:rhodanese-like domain-containing protein [Dyadobacter tibetensis]